MKDKVTNDSYWNELENVTNSKFTTPLPSRQFLEKYIPKGGRVLDFGCGYGRLTKLLIEYGYDVVGVDISKHLIEKAQKSCPNAKYYVSSVQKYDPTPDGPFDAILILAVIENIISQKERKELVVKVQNSLKKGGIVLLETFIYDDRNNEQYNSNRIAGKPKGVFFVKKAKSNLILFNDTAGQIDKLFIGPCLKKIYDKKLDFSTWSGEKQNGYVVIYQKMKD